MRKFAFLIFAALSLHVFGQGNQMFEEPKVDKRVELLSIVFRLAGNSEYNATQFKLYTDKIEQHFGPFKNHELIKFAEKLRNENEISFDVVMSMAVHIDENLNPRTEFAESSLEQRWDKDDAVEFVRLLQSFYKESKFEEFFKDNEKLYREATVRFLPVYDLLDLDWHNSFYGENPSEKFSVILALGNGRSSYGVDYKGADDKREAYVLLGAGSVDNVGMVEYETEINTIFPILVHEFNHSYVNPLLDKYNELFRLNGEKIFKILEPEMRSQAYDDWKTVLDEALVRASVIKYLIDHDYDKALIESLSDHEISSGFLWIRNLVAELEKYDSQRNLYPTLESYIQNLAEAYNSFAETVVNSQSISE